jgi:hypothetical protein
MRIQLSIVTHCMVSLIIVTTSWFHNLSTRHCAYSIELIISCSRRTQTTAASMQKAPLAARTGDQHLHNKHSQGRSIVVYAFGDMMMLCTFAPADAAAAVFYAAFQRQHECFLSAHVLQHRAATACICCAPLRDNVHLKHIEQSASKLPY